MSRYHALSSKVPGTYFIVPSGHMLFEVNTKAGLVQVKLMKAACFIAP